MEDLKKKGSSRIHRGGAEEVSGCGAGARNQTRTVQRNELALDAKPSSKDDGCPGSNQTPLLPAAYDLVKNGSALDVLGHVGSANRALCLVDQIKKPPNTNLRDYGVEPRSMICSNRRLDNAWRLEKGASGDW